MSYLKKWINNSNFDKFWLDKIKKNKPETHFLVMLAPLLKKAEQTFTKLLQKDAVLRSLLSNENLSNFLLIDFTNLFTNFLSRVCVYELHAASRDGMLKGETPTDRFNDFIQNLASQEITVAILGKYPALANLIKSIYAHYIEQQTILLKRIAQDLPELIDVFFNGKQVYQITKIERSGDQHKNGACVAIIQFDADENRKIVYKPRSTKVDLAFQKIIDWLNKKNVLIQLKYNRIVNKDNYSWCEYIKHELCQSEEEIIRYYQRMGALLSLSYTLGTSDLHGENIIAQGEYPHLVDVECLLRPVIEQNDKLPLENIIHHVVIDTLLLPNRVLMSDNFDGYDVSGISGNPKGKGPAYSIHWEYAGTDLMKMVRKASDLKSFVNIPFADSSSQVYDYEQVIIDEFRKGYKLFLKCREELLSIDSPLNHFKNCEIRVLLRPTHCYSRYIAECNHPKILSDIKAFKSHFRALKKDNNTQKFSKHIIQSELNDLLNRSIPYFTCEAEGTIIYDSKRKPLNLPVRISCLDRVKAQLKLIYSEKDLSLQVLCIENSFTALRHNTLQLVSAVVTHPKEVNSMVDDEIPLSIAKRELDILARTMLMREGYITWSSLDLYNNRFWLPSFTGLNLYNGIPGIAITFAYASKLFDNDEYEKIAFLCLDYITSRIEQQDVNCVQRIGAFNGLGGLIYTYGVLYTLLTDKRTLTILKKLIKWTNNISGADNHHDIVFGNAGLIAALYSVRHIISQRTLTELLRNKAQTICTKFSPADADAKQLGFSHGIAGMSWSLSKCLNLGIDNIVREWVKNAIHHQRLLISKQKDADNLAHGNYSWCHGDTGIGMSRLLMMESGWSDTLFASEIEDCLEATIKHGLTLSDNLCHGTLGNLELLKLASQNANYYHYRNKYEKEKSNIFSRIYRDCPTFVIDGYQPSPGLMTGRAGVAYQMMRLTRPQQVSSVMLLEEGIA